MGATSGLIIAFVVVVWAAYFIPLALRRYDDASKNASVETTGSLSRVINRRATVVEVVETSTSVVEVVESGPVEAPASVAAATAAPPPARTLDRPAARLAARRRRRTLLTLLALAAVVGGLAGLGVISTVWAAAPVALIVAWLVACRVQVRAERGIARVKVPRAPKASTTPKAAKLPRKRAESRAADEEETIIVSGQFEDINPGRKHEMEQAVLEPEALDDQIVIAVPSVSTTGEALWDPLPVTLPTYVTKPRAGRTVRTIDFSQPNTWTSGHIEGEDVEMPKRDGGAEDERRAVGH